MEEINAEDDLPGFLYIEKAISSKLHNQIVDYLNDSEDWFSVSTGKNSRKVIHYGYQYNYLKGTADNRAPPLPKFAKKLKVICYQTGKVPVNQQLDQCLINKYEPGQGINAHTDSEIFDEFICCFTIGSGAYMEFTKGNKRIKKYVKPRSLYIMSGDSRYKWKHEMRNIKSDIVDNKKKKRDIRISITFRTILANKNDVPVKSPKNIIYCSILHRSDEHFQRDDWILNFSKVDSPNSIAMEFEQRNNKRKGVLFNLHEISNDLESSFVFISKRKYDDMEQDDNHIFYTWKELWDECDSYIKKCGSNL